MPSPPDTVIGTAPNNSTLEGKEHPVIWMPREFDESLMPKLEVVTSGMVGGFIVFGNHIPPPTNTNEETLPEDGESRTRPLKVEEID